MFSFQDTKFCPFGADVQSCTRTKGLHRFRYRPSLFQHIGIYSSLKGKIQKLKDRDFGKNVKFFKPHQNPPVSSIISTLKDYDKHTINSCYEGQNFFWALQPKKDDTIEFKYDPPLILHRYTPLPTEKEQTFIFFYCLEFILNREIPNIQVINSSIQQSIYYPMYNQENKLIMLKIMMDFIQ